MGADRYLQARRDALAWYIRLSNTTITTARLVAFDDWQRDPLNAAAYQRLEDETKARAAKIA